MTVMTSVYASITKVWNCLQTNNWQKLRGRYRIEDEGGFPCVYYCFSCYDS